MGSRGDLPGKRELLTPSERPERGKILKIMDFPSSISQKSQFWRKKVTPGARQGWIFNGFQEKSQFFSSIQLRVDLSPSSGKVEKKMGHSFEGESCMLSIYDVFRAL